MTACLSYPLVIFSLSFSVKENKHHIFITLNKNTPTFVTLKGKIQTCNKLIPYVHHLACSIFPFYKYSLYSVPLSNMSLKSTNNNRKMRRGFMCHSQASTAVCMSTGDRRSVVVPRKPDRAIFLDDTRLINYAKYSKLVEPRRFEPIDRKALMSLSVQKIKQKREKGQDQEKEPKAFHHQATVDHQVFQVT